MPECEHLLLKFGSIEKDNLVFESGSEMKDKNVVTFRPLKKGLCKTVMNVRESR